MLGGLPALPPPPTGADARGMARLGGLGNFGPPPAFAPPVARGGEGGGEGGSGKAGYEDPMGDLVAAPGWYFYGLILLVTAPGVLLLVIMWALDKSKSMTGAK